MIVGDLLDSLKSAVKTTVFFVLFCALLPLFVISYATVATSRKLWIAFLANRYPYLKFARTNNIRSLVDTSRNPGVFHVLLQVEGSCDIHAIKAKFIDHVLGRRDHTGRLCFSRLKFPLISCWGQYAFVKKTKDFNIDNHIILSPLLHRGRPLTEANLQEYVSEIISKYMPPDISPWQIFCIPMFSSSPASGSAECDSNAPYYYLLYRIHHLLLEEQDKLRIADLLLIDNQSELKESDATISECGSIFTNLMEKPRFIPRIWGDLCVTISNVWNEFVYQHDPLESPDIERKHIAGIQQLISVILIGAVAVVSDFSKGFWKVPESPLMKIDFLKSLIDREIQRRNLNLGTIWNAITASFDPINVIKEGIFISWKIGATLTLMVPWYVFREIEAIRIYILLKKAKRNTVIGFLLEYVPIFYGALLEYWKGVKLLYTAPKLVYEEIFELKPNTGHYLQNVSLCGRKVVSWSESIKTSDLEVNSTESSTTRRTGSNHSKQNCNSPSQIEILLAIMSSSLRALCQDGDGKIPSHIQISGRCMLQDYLFGNTNYWTGNSGFVSLNLPVVEGLDRKQLFRAIRSSITQIHHQQVMLNFLTVAQLKHDFLTDALPLVVMKLLMNYLSRRFAVTVTEIIENQPFRERKNLLGHVVRDIIYFRPPQSNTSVSITIQTFNGEVRFACMADSNISPKHLALTSGFRKQFVALKEQ
ncbi:uncharacterized protein LOC129727814 [Wyeomyia smithii]|uniref:uncharacterized protein LOC129727814 n=1 Tax=Wyeomyia smithii TaxID=174621 RepID=UPI002467D58E|nr:uncharacterized protein LOC129727814 [Wyeomyia smithii]